MTISVKLNTSCYNVNVTEIDKDAEGNEVGSNVRSFPPNTEVEISAWSSRSLLIEEVPE